MKHELARAAGEGYAVGAETALAILRSGPEDMDEILAAATAMRRRFFGDRVHLCSIVNAKSGACPEDCAFCAQSVHHQCDVEIYGLKDAQMIAGARDEAGRLPIGHFGIVTSGPTLSDGDVARLVEVIHDNSRPGPAWCASLGSLTIEQLATLKAAGLKRFHHNLETAESFFPKICSTHTYADRLNTLRAAKAVGLDVCSGGLLGMGETPEQRVELAMTLAREQVDSIPLNVLMPIAGTRLENVEPMAVAEIIRTVAMFRMTNPRSEIKVCAGRVHLGSMQKMIFAAGATGMMIGPLLTVAGCDVEEDLKMIGYLGLKTGFERDKREEVT